MLILIYQPRGMYSTPNPLHLQVMTGDDWVNQMHDYLEVRFDLRNDDFPLSTLC